MVIDYQNEMASAFGKQCTMLKDACTFQIGGVQGRLGEGCGDKFKMGVLGADSIHEGFPAVRGVSDI